MKDKDSVLHRIWDGCIPICFRLAPEEVTHDDPALPPFFMLVPRITYFPLVLENVLRQIRTYQESQQRPNFNSLVTVEGTRGSPCPDDLNIGRRSYADSCTNTTTEQVYWLESEPNPLKWHYQVGLLYDLYGSPNNLPWDLYIHFKNFPSATLLAPPVNRSSIEAIFMSTIKEADALKHRGAVVNEMLPRDHRQLWMGLSGHIFDQFWAVNRRFMQPFTQNKPRRQLLPSNDAPDDNEAGDQPTTPAISTEDPSSLMVAMGMKAFRYLPFRLYFSPLPLESTSSAMTIGEDALQTSPELKVPAFVQALVEPFQEYSGLPIVFTDVIDILLASPALRNTNLNRNDFAFLVHGIEVPPETPGQWLSENFAYPDNFIHIVARRRSSSVQL